MPTDPPLGLPAALSVLGCCRSKLLQHLRLHPHYRRVGRKYVFDPEHIEALKRSLHQEYQSRHSEAAPRAPAAPGRGRYRSPEEIYRSVLARAEGLTKRGRR